MNDVIGMVVIRREEIYKELLARGYENIDNEDIDKVLDFIDFDDFSDGLKMKCAQCAFWTIASACAVAGYPNKNLAEGEISWTDIAAQNMYRKAQAEQTAASEKDGK